MGSGAIPMDHLNLPLPIANRQSMLSDSSRESRYTPSPNPNDVPTEDNPHPSTTIPTIMKASVSGNATRHSENDGRAVRSSSLMGAESMVGHLNMHSPASVASPRAYSPALTTEVIRDAT